MEFSSALPDDYATRPYSLTTIDFDPKHLGIAIAAVPAGRLSFFMRHFLNSKSKNTFTENIRRRQRGRPRGVI
jgi:hypothetical protein